MFEHTFYFPKVLNVCFSDPCELLYINPGSKCAPAKVLPTNICQCLVILHSITASNILSQLLDNIQIGLKEYIK